MSRDEILRNNNMSMDHLIYQKVDFKNDNTILVITCCICFNEINDETRHVTECSHIFCKKCINKWFDIKNSNNTCPMCRTILNKESEQIRNLGNELLPVIDYYFECLMNWSLLCAQIVYVSLNVIFISANIIGNIRMILCNSVSSWIFFGIFFINMIFFSCNIYKTIYNSNSQESDKRRIIRNGTRVNIVIFINFISAFYFMPGLTGDRNTYSYMKCNIPQILDNLFFVMQFMSMWFSALHFLIYKISCLYKITI